MRTLKAAREWLPVDVPAQCGPISCTTAKQATARLTLSVRLHSRCRVDSISKQTVSGHFQTDHAGTDGTCKNRSQIWHRKRQTVRSGTPGTPIVIAHLSDEGVLKQEDRSVSEIKMVLLMLPITLTTLSTGLVHVKCLNESINSAAMSQHRLNTVSETTWKLHPTRMRQTGRDWTSGAFVLSRRVGMHRWKVTNERCTQLPVCQSPWRL